MVRERLAAMIATAVGLSVVTVAMPASATAKAALPGVNAPSDARQGAQIPQKMDGRPFEVPSRHTPKASDGGQRAPSTPTRAPASAEADRHAATSTVETPLVGTVRQWAGSDDTAGYYRKDFTLRGVGSHIEVWVANDLAFPAGDCRTAAYPDSTTVTDAQVAELIGQFDNTMYPKETAAFSTPPDRDGTHALFKPDANGNGGVYTGGGEKTVALIDNVRDDNFYQFPAVPTYTAGFFSSALTELFDRNTMTIDAFDWAHRTTASPPDAPTGDLCTSRPAKPWLYEGTFAHEWQHLLQYYVDPVESTWLNEGLSDLAMDLAGYSNTTATVDDPGAESHLFCFQGYGPVKTQANPNPRDCGGPQNSLNLWGEGADTNPNAVLADYGNAYSFVLFLYDRYGLDFISKLHRDAAKQGLASLEAQLAAVGVPNLYAVIHDYQTMVLLDKLVGDAKRGVIEGVAKDRVTTRSLRSSVNLDNPQAYSTPGAAPNGADYVLLQRDGTPVAGRDLRSVVFDGVRTLPAQPLAWTVVSNDPDRAGNPVLFSGDANNIDAAMVTSVAVPSTDPVLRFLAKYGAEANYDYGYVSVSTDGGATFTAVAGDKTVAGPLGPGLNGTTNGFEPRTFDLSAYAGKTVLLSIRYVSDGGTNEGGLRVDDITVGGTAVSDGSSLEPFDSPTEVKPIAVNSWNLRLIGLDEARHAARQIEVDGRDTVTFNRQLQALSRFPKVVAVVAYDEPTGQVQQYAPYTLTVNGVVQPGGTTPASS